MAAPDTPTIDPPVARLFVGTVVVPMPEARLKGAGVFDRLVVIAENNDGTVKVARINGDEGRHWPKVRPALLRPVVI